MKKIITIIFLILILGNVYRITKLEEIIFSTANNKSKKIEDFVKNDFVGNQIQFLLMLENAYIGLDNILKSELAFTLNHLKSIHYLKKEFLTISDSKFSLDKLSLLNQNRHIFYGDRVSLVKTIPYQLKNSIAIDLESINNSKAGKKNIKIIPRFDKEIYLFSIEKLKNSDYIEETDLNIEISCQKQIKKYYGYRITKFIELPEVIKNHEYFLVVRNF